MATSDRLRVAVAGASGYMGAELLRLLLVHPRVTLTGVTSERLAGEPLARVYPHLRGLTELPFHDLDAELAGRGRRRRVPRAAAHGVAARGAGAARRAAARSIDLSADYRLRDPQDYVTWYKAPHIDPAGLGRGGVRPARAAPQGHRRRLAGRLARAAIRWARSWRLAPLFKNGLARLDGIVIDGKSGVTGAGAQGRKIDPMYLYTEANENVQAYAHRLASPHAGDRAGAVGRWPAARCA